MSRWSRPITIGAATAPLATRSLNARPARWRSPWPSQQIRAGRPWNCDLLGRHLQPARERLVLREEVEHGLVGGGDVGRVARQRGPAERAAALAEQRADVGGDEAGVLERALVAAELGLGAQRVAVVEDLGALVLEADHRLDVAGHRLAGALDRAGLRALVGPVLERDAARHVGQRVVGGGLVGHDVDRRAAAQQLREDVGAVAEQADRQRRARVAGRDRQLERVVDVIGLDVEVARSPAGARSATDRPRRRSRRRRPC